MVIVCAQFFYEQVINFELSTKHIPSLLQELGMSAYEDPTLVCIEQCYPVMLNGQLLGYLSDDMAQNVADQLRIMKVKRLRKVRILPDLF